MRISRKPFVPRFEGRTRTHLVIDSVVFRIGVCIEGHLQPRQRRTIALLVFRQLAPLLWRPAGRRRPSARIDHAGDSPSAGDRSQSDGISLAQAPDLSTEHGELGYAIRMRRLEMRLTQAELARAASLDRGHLGQIELGARKARPATLRRIEEVLGKVELPSLD